MTLYFALWFIFKCRFNRLCFFLITIFIISPNIRTTLSIVTSSSCFALKYYVASSTSSFSYFFSSSEVFSSASGSPTYHHPPPSDLNSAAIQMLNIVKNISFLPAAPRQNISLQYMLECAETGPPLKCFWKEHFNTTMTTFTEKSSQLICMGPIEFNLSISVSLLGLPFEGCLLSTPF